MIPSSLTEFIVAPPKEDWRGWGAETADRVVVLRFDDRVAMAAAFAAADIAVLEEADFPCAIGDISIIGAVEDQPAVVAGDEVVTPATFLDGWYVNVLLAEPASVGSVGETLTPGPAPAPLAISPRQARLALLSLGLLDQVNDLVSQGPAEPRIAWDYSLEVRRDDPGVIALATQLGIADQLPDLFAMAATL